MQKIIWLNHRDIRHPRAGGAERTIYEVTRRLFKRGYDIYWLSTKANGLPQKEKIEGVDIYRIGGNLSSHFTNLLFEHKHSLEAVTIDDMAHVVPWLSERLASIPGTVFFRHLHRRTLDGQMSRGKAALLKKIESSYPLMYRKWPFVTESRQGMYDLANLGISKDRIVRIPPGVDHNLTPMNNKYDFPSLIYFGGMRDYKRPYEALYLLNSLRKIYPKIKLRVSGIGPSLENLVSLANRLGLNNNVEFLGRLDEKILFDIVSRSWLNLHFSTSEGWGLSILEASSCGTPTLAYDVPGVSEVIEEGHNGIKVEDMDQDQLLNKAISIIDSYGTWVERSREVASKYSWDKTTDMWEKHLLSLT